MAMLLWQPKVRCFAFGSQDWLRPHLAAILDGSKIENLIWIWLENPEQNSKLWQMQLFCDDDVIDEITVQSWKYLRF